MTVLRVILAALGALVITVFLMWGSKELIADRLTEEGMRVLPLEHTPDSYLTVPVRSAQCQDMESSVRLAIARSQVCSTDSDCAVISLGCPFGCATPIQSTAYFSISTLNESFQNRCAYCLSGCDSDPPPAVCRAGQCALERFPSRPPLPDWDNSPG